jgi:hypothetical protein
VLYSGKGPLLSEWAVGASYRAALQTCARWDSSMRAKNQVNPITSGHEHDGASPA